MNSNALSVSVDLLQILLNYASQLGIEESVITSECGINLSDFKLSDTRIPMSEFHIVWSHILQHSQDPDFGLHFGVQSHSLLSRHLLYAMMMNCENVEQAIKKNFLYHNLITDIIHPKLSVEGDLAFMTWEMGHPALNQERHFAESILALFVSMLRFLTEDRIKLNEVRFTHAFPERTLEHERIFQAPLLFEKKSNEIVLEASYLNSPILMANPRIFEGLEQLVQKTLHRVNLPNSWMDKVTQLLSKAVLKEEKTDIETIARRFAMSERNLQLKLKEEGTSFRNLLDAIRKEIAIGYLEDENAAFCEIALLLGFADQSAFHHAFKRWTGQTPGAFRKKRLKPG
ncbi:AraC family transcriptional regulator [bacterium]|nr:AraC family transcriptional regulator [bacterium]